MARRRKGARLEMTSLMDVVFLVLVFFVYSIFDMAVHRGVKVDLPDGAGQLETGGRIVVTILSNDSLQLDGAPMRREALVAHVARLASTDPCPPVIIAGDRAASLGTGVGLLSDLRRAGVDKITVQVSGASGK